MVRTRSILAVVTVLAFACPSFAIEPTQKSSGKQKNSTGSGKGCVSGHCGRAGGGASGRGLSGRIGCHKCKALQTYEGQDAWANCGCNGSYKFPVPPLSTYHWPGMAAHRLMTNYHSPWRFPPLKPFEDEDTADEMIRLQPTPPSRHHASRAQNDRQSGANSFKPTFRRASVSQSISR